VPQPSRSLLPLRVIRATPCAPLPPQRVSRLPLRYVGRPGDPDPQTRGVNYLNRAGDAPEGSTEAYLDGHVRWVPFVKSRARPKLRLDSTAGVFEHYFHGGRDDLAIR
jgi:hypothetical protein